MSETKDDDSIWGVVHSGPLTFIGAFCDFDRRGERDTIASRIERVVLAVQAGNAIRLEPVIELTAPWQAVRHQTPAGERAGMARSALPSPYGFTTGGVRLRVFSVNAIAFINEMNDADQKLYNSYIKSILDAERAQRSGIEVVSGLGGGPRA